MTDALTRIIEYPHYPVFDKDPKAQLALRVRHAAGLAMEVSGGVLRLTSDQAVVEYPLAGVTIGELADRLRDDGYDVVFESPDLTGRAAHVLLAGARSQDQSNGDQLQAYTSLLWALYGSYSTELDDAAYQVIQALRQMVLTQAEYEWLDVWANLYGVPRNEDELDAALQVRIPEEVFRLRVNGLAIEKAIKDITGRDVELREPWKRMFTLDQSRLSGIDHFHDSTYYSYHVIHPVARQSFDWAEVLKVIRRNKAAGIDIYPPAVEFPAMHVVVQPPVEYAVSRVSDAFYSIGAWPGGEVPLGIMRLSDNELTLNHPVVMYQLRTIANAEGLQTEQEIGRPRSIAYAAIVLSDGVPLGDENAILSRGQELFGFDPDPTLSEELALSDYDATQEIRRVERVLLDQHAALLVWQTTVSGSASREDVATLSASLYEGENPWVGDWDDRMWIGWRYAGMAMTSTPA